MRPEIKATLNLPQEASNEYLYGSSKSGCCGFTTYWSKMLTLLW